MRLETLFLAMLFALTLVTAPSGESIHPGGAPPAALPHLMPPAPPHAWPQGVVQGAPVPPPSPAQTSGTARLAVLLVEFTDVAHDAAHDAAYVDGTFNAAGPNARSMRAYYEEVSFGALTVQATVVPTWWPSVRTMAYYGDDGAKLDDANGSIYDLITETVQLADPSVDFSTFDADGNDIVDHLVVVHAGGAQEEDPANVTRIWSHQWNIPSLFLDGVWISEYIMVSEDSPVGVVAHEFAHDLGSLPDLYDTDESSEGGVGRWDLMAQGAWNGFPAGASPAHVSAWSRIRLGWAAPSDPTASDVLFRPVETTGFVLRLPIPGSSSEYFLVENRQPIGFDAALPGSGLLIWHVDGTRETRGGNDDDARRWVDLEEADEVASGDRPLDPQDAWSDTPWGFGPETTPGTEAYDGSPTGWRVRDVSASAPAMTARVLRAIPRDTAIVDIRLPGLVAPNMTVDADVVLVNEGSSAETVNVTLRVYRDQVQAGALVVERRANTTIPSLASSAVRMSFPVGPEGRYIVHAAIGPGDDVPWNDERVRPVLVRDLYFQDTMESGSTPWTTDGGPSDPHRWLRLDSASENGSAHSLRSAWRFGLEKLAAPNPSPPAWHALTSAPVAVPAGPVHLIFYQRYALWGRPAPGPAGPGESDEALVEVRSGAGPWTTVARFTGRDMAWRGVSQNLSADVTGPTTLQVRFNVSSAVMPDRGGWWIDDIAIASGGLGRALLFLGAPLRFETAPGTTARLAARLANVGDYEETIELSAVLPGPRWIAGVELPGGSSQVGTDLVRLGPGRDAVLRLSISVEHEPTGSLNVTITARSQNAPEVRATLVIEFLVTPAAPSPPWAFIGAILVAAVALTAIGGLAFRRRHPRT